MDHLMKNLHETMESFDFTHFDKSKLTIDKRISSGYIGEVYEGTLELFDEKEPVIIKKLTSDNYNNGVNDEYLYNDTIDEVRISHKFMDNSKRLIRFYGYSHSCDSKEVILYLIMEKTSAKYDLGGYLYDNPNWVKLTEEEYNSTNSLTTLSHKSNYWDYILSYKEKLHIMHEIGLSIKELHSHKIVHCDLKPNNMLYVCGTIVLIDFNASYFMGEKNRIQGKSYQGTPGYMPKEMCRGVISYASDVYSMGVCFLEVWFGDIWPKQTDRYDKNRKYIMDYLSLLEEDNPKIHSIVKQCVSKNPEKRPTVDNVIEQIENMIK